MDERGTSGLRRSRFTDLADEEIEFLKSEIRAIDADDNVFAFNQGDSTSYVDEIDTVFVRGDVFPNKNSSHPRDLMSARAVLAHEYYGHRANRGTRLTQGSWQDEFRASYMAAQNAPNLSQQDRAYLIMDALERAKDKGVNIRHNNVIRGILHGF